MGCLALLYYINLSNYYDLLYITCTWFELLHGYVDIVTI